MPPKKGRPIGLSLAPNFAPASSFVLSDTGTFSKGGFKIKWKGIWEPQKVYPYEWELPGTCWRLAGAKPPKRKDLDDLVGIDAELLAHLLRADLAVLDRVEHGDARADQLHQVLV